MFLRLLTPPPSPLSVSCARICRSAAAAASAGLTRNLEFSPCTAPCSRLLRMSSALRAVRELRGEDVHSRPSTAAGGRPGTSAGRPSSAVLAAAAAASDAEKEELRAQVESLRKELDESRAALEKERRQVRALESYLSEQAASKDTDIASAVTEAKQAQAALSRAEAHAAQLDELYKSSTSKLVERVERIAAAARPSTVEAEESFAAVLREEMQCMQAAFQIKIDRLQADLTQRTADFQRQIRTLNEELTTERAKSERMAEKLRSPVSPSPLPSPTAAAQAASLTATSGAKPTSAAGSSSIGKTSKPVVKK